jgi:hypothetical protein
MQRRKALLGLLATLALGACNVIDDHAPTFGPSKTAPPLKPGMWQTPSHCETSPPLARGMTCTPHPDEGGPFGQLVVTPKALHGLDAKSNQPGVAYVISPGAPMLMQIQVDVPDKRGQSGLRPGRNVVFLALEPEARDAAGQITAATVWPVLCGPAPQLDSPDFDWNDGKNNVTKHPFGGLTLDGMTCTARDETSIRAAALASRSVFAQTLHYAWATDAPAN